MRTPLTYYGGKQRLASQIVDLFPAHRVYVEPFAGGAAVLFAKPRVERETLNDLDGQIVAFWRALRDEPDALAEAVASTPYSREEWQRSAEPAGADVEAARRLLVSVDQSFSRSRTSWSSPYLGDRMSRWRPGSWDRLPDLLAAAADRLRGVALEQADAAALIPRYDQPGTVIYCDPPYALATRNNPRHRYPLDDDGSLWPKLVDALSAVEKAAVVVSGYACEEMDRLGWRMLPLHRARTVARENGTIERAPEVVWVNERIEATPASLFEGAEAA